MAIQAWLRRVLNWITDEINLVPSGTRSRRRVVNNVVRQFINIYPGTEYVFWSLENANVRITFDGQAPVPGTFGHLIVAGSTGVWHIDMASAARFIAEGAANAAFHVTPMVRRI